jgi:CRP/FNR family transcriptional regulator
MMSRDCRSYGIDLSEATKIGTFQECPIFKDLPQIDMEELASQAKAIVFRKGSLIFKEGDAAASFYLVHDGLVQIYKTSVSGKEVTFTVAAKGETLNAAALSVVNYFLSARAMRDATVLQIGRNDYHAFVDRHASLTLRILSLLSQRLSTEYDKIVDIVGAEVESRLVHCLCLLATKFGLTLSLTRQELANYVGTTTETTIRVLAKLRRNGLISCSSIRGEIVITDLEALRNSVV